MKLKQIIAYVKALWVKYTTKPELTKRQLCELKLKKLQLMRFELYSPELHGQQIVPALFSTLSVYAKEMRMITKVVEEGNMILPQMVNLQESKVTLDSLLCTGGGFYEDPVNSVASFNTAGLALCQALASSDQATHGLEEHNKRMLTKLFDNMSILLDVMLNISLTKSN